MRSIFFGSFLAVMALFSGNLWAAEPAAARAEAKRLKDLAVAAKHRSDYPAALQYYREALKAFESPNLHFDLALVLKELGRYAEAVDEFEVFLAYPPGEHADSRGRPRALAEVDTLSKRVARLEVTTNEAGAEVAVDSKRIGSTPLTHPIRVMPGDYVVAVTKKGFFPSHINLQVSAGESRTIEVNLTRIVVPAPPLTSVAPQSTDPARAPMPNRELVETGHVVEISSPRRRYLAPIAVAVSAVSVLAVGAGLLGSAETDYHSLQNACKLRSCGPSDWAAPEARGNAGIALLTIGGVAVAVDVVLWSIAVRRNRSSHSALHISPSSSAIAGADF